VRLPCRRTPSDSPLGVQLSKISPGPSFSKRGSGSSLESAAERSDADERKTKMKTATRIFADSFFGTNQLSPLRSLPF
jgi:hypothetical protein